MSTQNLGRQFSKKAYLHDALRPMKDTLKAQGVSFASVSGHLKKNAHLIFGENVPKADQLSWAVRKHAEDPENFLKNIGFK